MNLHHASRALSVVVVLAAAGMSGCGSSSPASPTEQTLVYASVYRYDNYTDWNLLQGGLAEYKLEADGSLTPVGPLVDARHEGPCALAVTPDGRSLFVGDFEHYMYSYLINGQDGSLTYANETAGLPNHAPYYSMIADSTGQFLYSAEQSTSTSTQGMVSAYQVGSADGSFSAGPTTQSLGASPGGIVKKGGRLYVGDSAYTQSTVRIFDIGSDGALTENASLSPYLLGSGIMPDQIAAHPTQGFLYLTDSANNQVLTLTIGADGSLGSPVATHDGDSNQPRSVASDPLGRFVFTANYFSDTVSVYSVGVGGALTFADSYACTNPHFVAVDPTGKFLVVPSKGQNGKGSSHTISVFRIDGTTGALTLVDTADLGAGNEPSYLTIARITRRP